MSDDIEIKTTTLKASSRKLKVRWPPDTETVKAPAHGPYGLVIGKDRCPCCRSENVEIEEGDNEGWGGQCLNCQAIWGIDSARDGVPSAPHVHTGEVVRQLIEANSGD